MWFDISLVKQKYKKRCYLIRGFKSDRTYMCVKRDKV